MTRKLILIARVLLWAALLAVAMLSAWAYDLRSAGFPFRLGLLAIVGVIAVIRGVRALSVVAAAIAVTMLVLTVVAPSIQSQRLTYALVAVFLGVGLVAELFYGAASARPIVGVVAERTRFAFVGALIGAVGAAGFVLPWVTVFERARPANSVSCCWAFTQGLTAVPYGVLLLGSVLFGGMVFPLMRSFRAGAGGLLLLATTLMSGEVVGWVLHLNAEHDARFAYEPLLGGWLYLASIAGFALLGAFMLLVGTADRGASSGQQRTDVLGRIEESATR